MDATYLQAVHLLTDLLTCHLQEIVIR